MTDTRNVYFEAIDTLTDAVEMDRFIEERVASLQQKGRPVDDARQEVVYSINIALGDVDSKEITDRWRPVIEKLHRAA